MIPKTVTPIFTVENYGIADGIDKDNPYLVNGKKIRFVFDDGRHYINTTDEKYDIISSDPIDPWTKGAAALYTVEFFETCKAHLKPGGAMSLWVPLYETSSESVKSVVSTFFTVFPDGMIWSNDINGVGYDMVLIGQTEPGIIDIEKFEEKYTSDDYSMVRESLAQVGFFYPDDILSTYAGRAQDLNEWMADAEINTDRNLRLGYLAGRALNLDQASDILSDIMTFYKFPEDLFLGPDQKVQSLKQSISNKIQ